MGKTRVEVGKGQQGETEQQKEVTKAMREAVFIQRTNTGQQAQLEKKKEKHNTIRREGQEAQAQLPKVQQQAKGFTGYGGAERAIFDILEMLNLWGKVLKMAIHEQKVLPFAQMSIIDKAAYNAKMAIEAARQSGKSVDETVLLPVVAVSAKLDKEGKLALALPEFLRTNLQTTLTKERYDALTTTMKNSLEAGVGKWLQANGYEKEMGPQGHTHRFLKSSDKSVMTPQQFDDLRDGRPNANTALNKFLQDEWKMVVEHKAAESAPEAASSRPTP